MNNLVDSSKTQPNDKSRLYHDGFAKIVWRDQGIGFREMFKAKHLSATS